MMGPFLQIIVLAACAVIVARAEPALNRMGPQTPLAIRAAFHFLTVGAIAEILYIAGGGIPVVPAAITFAGVALFLTRDRRCRPGGFYD